MSNKLNLILEVQRTTQLFNAKKRDTIVSPDDEDQLKKLNAALYYWNCSTVEYFELMEKTTDPKIKLEDLQEEAIDILHFLLSQLIYIGFPEFYSDDYYFSDENVRTENNNEIMGRNITHHWTGVSYLWGKIVNQLPYKNWKTYDEIYVYLQAHDTAYHDCNLLMKRFIYLCYELQMDSEKIIETYMAKNKINIERQQKGGRYEK